MSPRKRRRGQAFVDEVEDSQVNLNEEEDGASDDKQREEKEQEVWDAIREAHYEAIEQLPLTLQRQLSLIRQHDEQSISFTASLLPALQKYIKQRRAMAGIFESQTEAIHVEQSIDIHGEEETSAPSQSSRHEKLDDSTHPKRQHGTSQCSLTTPTPRSTPPENGMPPETTRELLSQVGFMTDELLRASQEKVNIAQANHDSVNRHIQLLDQAIREQEATLSADPSHLSNGRPVYLPASTVPKWRQKSHSTPALVDEIVVVDPDQDDHLVVHSEYLGGPRRRSGTKVKSKKVDKDKKEQDVQGKHATSLTITLPATHQNEELLYCYCTRVSFGEMIACDSESCEREWFHLGCVGLTEIPEGEWFCEDCRIDEF